MRVLSSDIVCVYRDALFMCALCPVPCMLDIEVLIRNLVVTDPSAVLAPTTAAWSQSTLLALTCDVIRCEDVMPVAE